MNAVTNRGELSVTGDLTILGPGADLLAISGNDSFRVFNRATGTSVRIVGMTMLDGSATGAGGAIYSAADQLTIEECQIVDSVATTDGGGIYASGILNLLESTVADNSAAEGGGLALDGATIFIRQSSISENSATSGTGGEAAAGEGKREVIGGHRSWPRSVRLHRTSLWHPRETGDCKRHGGRSLHEESHLLARWIVRLFGHVNCGRPPFVVASGGEAAAGARSGLRPGQTRDSGLHPEGKGCYATFRFPVGSIARCLDLSTPVPSIISSPGAMDAGNSFTTTATLNVSVGAGGGGSRS